MVPTMFLLHSSVLQLLGPSCFAPRVDSVARGGELGVEVPLCPSHLMPPRHSSHVFSGTLSPVFSHSLEWSRSFLHPTPSWPPVHRLSLVTMRGHEEAPCR